MAKLPSAYEGDRPYIFISYAHKNAEDVLPAVRALQDAGYPVWYDAGIQAGTEWPEYIAEHLLKCALVIAFISKESIASPNCRQEIAFALDNNKPMITVRLDEATLSPGMQMRLNLCQALMAYRHSTREGYIDELVRAPFIAMTLNMTPTIETPPVVDDVIVTPKETSDAAVATGETSGACDGDFMDKVAAKLSKVSGKEVSGEKLWGVCCYLWLLFWVPLILKKNSEFVRFHVNQGLLCVLLSVAVSVVIMIFSWSYFLYVSAKFFGIILCIAASIFGIVNVLRGLTKSLPLIGKYRLIK